MFFVKKPVDLTKSTQDNVDSVPQIIFPEFLFLMDLESFFEVSS